MTRIVTTHYRYKRPPRKRKAVALEVPAIVTRASKRSTKPPSEPQAAAAQPANDDRKSAIVTTTSKKRLKFLRAERPAEQGDGDPEMRAWLLRAMQGRGPSR